MNELNYNAIIDEYCQIVQKDCNSLIEKLRSFESLGLNDKKVSSELQLFIREIPKTGVKYFSSYPPQIRANLSAVDFCKRKTEEIVTNMNDFIKGWESSHLPQNI